MTHPRTAEALPFDLSTAPIRPDPPHRVPWGWLIAGALIGGAIVAAGMIAAHLTVLAVAAQVAGCWEGCV